MEIGPLSPIKESFDGGNSELQRIIELNKKYKQELNGNKQTVNDLMDIVQYYHPRPYGAIVSELCDLHQSMFQADAEFAMACVEFESKTNSLSPDKLSEYQDVLTHSRQWVREIVDRFMDKYYSLKREELFDLVRILDMLLFEYDYLLVRYRLFTSKDKIASIFWTLYTQTNEFITQQGLTSPRLEQYTFNDYDYHSSAIRNIQTNIEAFILFEMGKIVLDEVFNAWKSIAVGGTLLDEIVNPIDIHLEFHNIKEMPIIPEYKMGAMNAKEKNELQMFHEERKAFDLQMRKELVDYMMEKLADQKRLEAERGAPSTPGMSSIRTADLTMQSQTSGSVRVFLARKKIGPHEMGTRTSKKPSPLTREERAARIASRIDQSVKKHIVQQKPSARPKVLPPKRRTSVTAEQKERIKARNVATMQKIYERQGLSTEEALKQARARIYAPMVKTKPTGLTTPIAEDLTRLSPRFKSTPVSASPDRSPRTRSAPPPLSREDSGESRPHSPKRAVKWADREHAPVERRRSAPLFEREYEPELQRESRPRRTSDPTKFFPEIPERPHPVPKPRSPPQRPTASGLQIIGPPAPEVKRIYSVMDSRESEEDFDFDPTMSPVRSSGRPRGQRATTDRLNDDMMRILEDAQRQFRMKHRRYGNKRYH